MTKKTRETGSHKTTEVHGSHEGDGKSREGERKSLEAQTDDLAGKFNVTKEAMLSKQRDTGKRKRDDSSESPSMERPTKLQKRNDTRDDNTRDTDGDDNQESMQKLMDNRPWLMQSIAQELGDVGNKAGGEIDQVKQ